ncbi:unnamed protein product [Candida verbasci]|uniref:Methyltransferase domain-containing protein n=1 Tax=Candida verbasci TaxID=1227364 RepID=A0A9W4TY48_9ASCO|nr:unnamed protein product [Candida verbasci]
MTERLNSSKLGTKDYWNEFYQKEIENFNENDEDLGECWFNDSNAEDKMIQYIIEYIEDNQLEKVNFLDLGTGNGHLLFQLYEDLKEEEVDVENFKFTGIDYSPDSVKFSSEIANKKYPNIDCFKFEQVDLLTENYTGKYDILLDKGTLDAIALNQTPIINNKIGMELYPSKIESLG